MTEKQEAEWLYAKGLELAILIKGKTSDLPKETFRYDDFLSENYGDLAEKIARKIINSATELKRPS